MRRPHHNTPCAFLHWDCNPFPITKKPIFPPELQWILLFSPSAHRLKPLPCPCSALGWLTAPSAERLSAPLLLGCQATLPAAKDCLSHPALHTTRQEPSHTLAESMSQSQNNKERRSEPAAHSWSISEEIQHSRGSSCKHNRSTDMAVALGLCSAAMWNAQNTITHREFR